MPVLIDYYILMETILSTDNHGKNMFFAVYDKEEDKKMIDDYLKDKYDL